MAAARRVMELEVTEEELADLERVSRSRTETSTLHSARMATPEIITAG